MGISHLKISILLLNSSVISPFTVFPPNFLFLFFHSQFLHLWYTFLHSFMFVFSSLLPFALSRFSSYSLNQSYCYFLPVLFLLWSLTYPSISAYLSPAYISSDAQIWASRLLSVLLLPLAFLTFPFPPCSNISVLWGRSLVIVQIRAWWVCCCCSMQQTSCSVSCSLRGCGAPCWTAAHLGSTHSPDEE